jgi:hypothetical protein
MYTDKITQAVAEAVKQILATEKLHPNQQKLDVHEPEKDELTSNDFKMLRKGKKADVKEANNPFDVKNYKSQLPTKPGELAGFDSKKISTGTVYTRKPVKDEKPMKEDLGQIDELSKTTLGSYIKKATNDKADRAYGNGWWDSRGGRTTYPPKDTPIENKTEVDQKQRNAGIKRAVNKLTREDIEQIDELSKTTLGSYIKKAADDKSKTAYDHGYIDYANDGDKPERVSMYDKVELGQKRRNAGIKRAVNKLTREEQDINAINGVKMSTIDEKHMTEPEMKKKEEIVKSMKKGLAGFKERYGDRAKDVMYATATKQAMKD